MIIKQKQLQMICVVQVSQYLRSKNWDTKVATAHAIGAIAENVNSFNVNKVLDFGALLAFGGQVIFANNL